MSSCGSMLALASAPHPKIKGSSSSLAAHQAFASLTHKDEFFKSVLGLGLIFGPFSLGGACACARSWPSCYCHAHRHAICDAMGKFRL